MYLVNVLMGRIRYKVLGRIWANEAERSVESLAVDPSRHKYNSAVYWNVLLARMTVPRPH